MVFLKNLLKPSKNKAWPFDSELSYTPFEKTSTCKAIYKSGPCEYKFIRRFLPLCGLFSIEQLWLSLKPSDLAASINSLESTATIRGYKARCAVGDFVQSVYKPSTIIYGRENHLRMFTTHLHSAPGTTLWGLGPSTNISSITMSSSLVVLTQHGLSELGSTTPLGRWDNGRHSWIIRIECRCGPIQTPLDIFPEVCTYTSANVDMLTSHYKCNYIDLM